MPSSTIGPATRGRARPIAPSAGHPRSVGHRFARCAAVLPLLLALTGGGCGRAHGNCDDPSDGAQRLDRDGGSELDSAATLGDAGVPIPPDDGARPAVDAAAGPDGGAAPGTVAARCAILAGCDVFVAAGGCGAVMANIDVAERACLEVAADCSAARACLEMRTPSPGCGRLCDELATCGAVTRTGCDRVCGSMSPSTLSCAANVLGPSRDCYVARGCLGGEDSPSQPYCDWACDFLDRICEYTAPTARDACARDCGRWRDDPTIHACVSAGTNVGDCQAIERCVDGS